MIEEVKSPSTVDFASFSQETETGQTAEVEPEVIDEMKSLKRALYI